jgi:RNA polymerase II-associated protein 1
MEIDEINSKAIEDSDTVSFPKPMTIEASLLKKDPTKSIFSEMMQHESEGAHQSDKMYEEIHNENVEKLKQMTHEEILEERNALMNSIDPAMLQFIKNRKKAKPEVKIEEKRENPPTTNNFPSLDFLQNESSANWLNMNVLEPEKLEWTKNIEQTFANLKPGESFEARFDWKGMLLPYIDKESLTGLKDDRELYLHGEESHRPGYTLQELFRLARATVIQQRISALSAIAGILNIYNQGFYDGILDLPIAKIFFFLRFALDENTPATIEVSSKALANLFYNDTDETLLDLIYEVRQGFRQPLMNSVTADKLNNEFSSNELESALEEMSLNEKVFESNVDNFDDTAGTEVNDFHLAEINLVECLVRTNIINRIAYILTTTRPNEITIMSCVKLLIRIARNSKEFAAKIFSSKILCETLINAMEDQHESSYLIFKLFRVIASHDIALVHFKYVEKVKQIIANRGDLNVNLLKSQIECFRFIRLYFIITTNDALMGEILFSLRYLLEWHYQFLDFHANNHFIIRMHASAILNLLTCSNLVLYATVLLEIVKMSCSKWFYMASRENVTECSQKILLSAALEVTCASLYASESFHDFFDDYLKAFLKSKAYKNMENSLISASPLLKDFIDRSSVHKPLKNLGSIIRRSRKAAPTLVLTQDYSTYFIDSLHRLMQELKNADKDQRFQLMLSEIFYSDEVENYLNVISNLTKVPPLAKNWFVRNEINFICKLILHRNDKLHQNTLKIALILLNCLTCDNSLIALEMFDKIIFNSRFYSGCALSDELARWKYIFNGVVMSKVNTEVVIILLL